MLILQSFLERGTKYPWRKLQSVEKRLKERPSWDCLTWGSIPYTVTKPRYYCDANKCLLTGDWYSCLLRGSARAWQIQKWVLTAIHWMEHRVPNEGAWERTQGPEGVCSLIGGTTIWTNQYPQRSHQPKKTYGVTHGSRCICSRGWPSQSSIGGEALDPVKVLCLSIGECQGQEVGVGRLWIRGRGKGVGDFQRRN